MPFGLNIIERKWCGIAKSHEIFLYNIIVKLTSLWILACGLVMIVVVYQQQQKQDSEQRLIFVN